jgi:hypothetical protein
MKIEQLLDLAQGRAGAALADQIQAHLASGCARCQANWNWIQKVAWLAATDDSLEPPQWVLERAVRLFQAYGPEPKPSRLKRLVASLVFDSLAQMQPVGIRQTAQAERQFLYQAGDWDVDLLFEAGDEPGMISITGQVLSSSAAIQELDGIPVHLGQAGKILISTVTDRLGEFTFDHVPSGTYELSLELHGQQLWIEHLDVKLAE